MIEIRDRVEGIKVKSVVCNYEIGHETTLKEALCPLGIRYMEAVGVKYEVYCRKIGENKKL